MLLPFLFCNEAELHWTETGGACRNRQGTGTTAKDDKERESYLSRTGVMKNAFFISSFRTWDSKSDAALDGSM